MLKLIIKFNIFITRSPGLLRFSAFVHRLRNGIRLIIKIQKNSKFLHLTFLRFLNNDFIFISLLRNQKT